MPAKHAELLNLLEQGARLCEDNPRYLSEKIPDWEDGLAMSRVNKLAGKAVYEYREQIEDGHRQRWLTFNHPDEDMPVRLEVYANRPSQSAVNRAANHIRAWKAAIAGGGKASGADRGDKENERLATKYLQIAKRHGATMTVRDLAKKMGVSTGYVNNLEAWKNRPAKNGRGRPRGSKQSQPRTVQLNDCHLDNLASSGDGGLDDLIREQELEMRAERRQRARSR